MATEIKAPQFPESVADGTVATWPKQEGEAVKRDELLVDIETDKVVLEVVAPADGVISKILAGEGDTVESQQVLANFEEGASGSAPAPASERILACASVAKAVLPLSAWACRPLADARRACEKALGELEVFQGREDLVRGVFEGAQTCAPQSCPWGPHARAHVGSCLAGICSEPTIFNAPLEIAQVVAGMPPSRNIIAGYYATGHSSSGQPTARYVSRLLQTLAVQDGLVGEPLFLHQHGLQD